MRRRFLVGASLCSFFTASSSTLAFVSMTFSRLSAKRRKSRRKLWVALGSLGSFCAGGWCVSTTSFLADLLQRAPSPPALLLFLLRLVNGRAVSAQQGSARAIVNRPLHLNFRFCYRACSAAVGEEVIRHGHVPVRWRGSTKVGEALHLSYDPELHIKE